MKVKEIFRYSLELLLLEFTLADSSGAKASFGRVAKCDSLSSEFTFV